MASRRSRKRMRPILRKRSDFGRGFEVPLQGTLLLADAPRGCAARAPGYGASGPLGLRRGASAPPTEGTACFFGRTNIATTQWLAMMSVKTLPGFCFGVRVTRAALCAGRGTAFRPVHAKAASRGNPLAAALQIICRACEAPGGSSVCLTGRAVRGERSTGFPTRATDRNGRAPVAWASGPWGRREGERPREPYLVPTLNPNTSSFTLRHSHLIPTLRLRRNRLSVGTKCIRPSVATKCGD